MAVIKNTPRYLKIDDDNKILQPNEMPHALNVRVTQDAGGNSGVIKNIPSNAVTNLNLGYGLGTNKVIGTYEHEGTNRLFVFVWNSLGVNTIYEMNQGESGFTKIIESSNILLSGEHLHIDGMVVNDDLHLYFTDGVNEPQKINVDAGLTIGTYPSSQNEAAVMKVAPWAPTVEFKTDTSRDSNEISGRSFQFALQYVYRDGEVSAIGEYSDNFASANTLDTTVNSETYLLRENKIEIGLGGGTLGLGLGTTIPKIRIFFRDVYNNTMYYVGEYTSAQVFNKVDFYNDGSYSVVSDAEYNKIQDAVPRSSKAQAISSNRLFYGNYEEGFVKPTVSSSLSLNLQSKPLNARFPETLNGTFSIDIDTQDVTPFLNGVDDIPSYIRFNLDGTDVNNFLFIDDNTPRTFNVYLSSGAGLVTMNNVNMSLALNLKEFFKFATISATTSYSSYNTALASAITGTTFTFTVPPSAPVSHTEFGTTYSMVFQGIANATMSAIATATGITLSVNIDSYSVNLYGIIRSTGNDQLLLGATADVDETVALNNVVYNNLDIKNGSSQAIEAIDSKTFKSAESHSLGVVFEDQYGRTSGVQEIGSITVPPLGSRDESELGAAWIDATVTASGLDPAITNFFFVYSGGNSIEDYVQYSVGEAFLYDPAVVVTDSSANIIHLSLRTLQGKSQSFCSEDSGQIEYEFSEGDKLRVIRYRNADGDIVYPEDHIFDIIDLHTHDEDLFSHNHSDELKAIGQFLVIKNRNIVGFRMSDVLRGDDFWDDETLVEIYSPKKEQQNKIYRAIEGKYSISDLGTTKTLKQGNSWFKRRNIKLSSNSDNTLSNSVMYVESNVYNDQDRLSKGQLGGKPYAVINSERKQVRTSSVTYSDAQFVDSAQNNLSSFNNSLANFADYELNYGGIYGLVDASDSIVILQSDKVSRAPISRQILSTATGNSFVTQSTDVLGLQQHYQGNFGINEDRSAFLKADGDVYLVDVTRSKIVSITPQGVSVISDEGVDSWVGERCDSMLEDPQGYFVSIGQDKDNDEIIFSLQNKPISNTDSIVFSKKLGKFTSFASYTGAYYGNLGNRFFQIRDNNAYEAEKGTTYSNFFGIQCDASFTTVFNASPSITKVFQALSMESNRPADITIETAKNSATIDKNIFSEREDAWYGYIPRSEGSSEYMILGVVSSEDDPKITFSSRVSRIPFRLGGDAYVYSNGSYIPLNANVDGVIDSNSLSFTNAGAISVGDVIAIKSDSSIDGDAVRGHYAKVQYVLDDSSKFEVFAVNASVAQSSLNNNGGSQQ